MKLPVSKWRLIFVFWIFIFVKLQLYLEPQYLAQVETSGQIVEIVSWFFVGSGIQPGQPEEF